VFVEIEREVLAEGLAAYFAQPGNMAPSKSSLDHLPKALSAHWEAGREALEAALRQGFEVPAEAKTVAISLDGVMMPMKDSQRQEKRGKQTRGPAGYHEAGCGTLSFYDAGGERLSTLRFGHMPEPGKATLKSTLSAELDHVFAQRPDLTVDRRADEAKGNWTFLCALEPEREMLVDFFHAAEHLKRTFDAAYGEGPPKAQAQLTRYRHLPRPRLSALQASSKQGAGAQARLLPPQSPPHALRPGRCTPPTHRLRHRRGRLQDPGLSAHEALGHALAHPRRPGHPDPAFPHPERALRAGLAAAGAALQARGHVPRERRHDAPPPPNLISLRDTPFPRIFCPCVDEG
jgi:hypothetical protein